MKLYTPDNSLLIDVESVTAHQDGILIEGTIMGALPMKAILRADDLRAGKNLLTWGIIRKAIKMWFQGRPQNSEQTNSRGDTT